MGELIKHTARALRRNQTKAEEILWQALRNRKLCGKKFLRQHPLPFRYFNQKRFFIADFYCHEVKLVVEADGPIHERQKEYDGFRDSVMGELNLRLLRFKNREIIEDLEGVLAKIRSSLTPQPPLSEREGVIRRQSDRG